MNYDTTITIYGWKSLGYESYFHYTSSELFKEKKLRLLHLRGEFCERCGCGNIKETVRYKMYYGKLKYFIQSFKTKFQLHHTNYLKVGNEGLNDLMILCEECHNIITKFGDSKMDQCDICGKKTNQLVDYYSIICYDCRDKHTDIILLQTIARYKQLVDDLKKRK